MTELLRIVRVTGPAMSPFAAATLRVVSVSEHVTRVRWAAAHDVEVIPANTKSECEVIYQAVDNALMPKEMGVLIVDVSRKVRRCQRN